MTLPIQRMTWQEAMDRFGSDKPDLRFGMEIMDVSDLVKDCGFGVFSGAVADGGLVRAVCAEGLGDVSSKKMKNIEKTAKDYGAKGLAYIQLKSDGTIKCPFAKFLSEEELQKLIEAVGAKQGDLVVFAADKFKVVCDALGALRLKFADELNLLDKSDYKFVWITEFPLLEWSEEQGRYTAMHHPFTHPKDEDIPLLDTNPAAVRADAYDMVCNGIEVGGGSIRIHDAQLQAKMFEILGFTPEKAEEQFGFLMNAFKFGAPPHGGLAYGLDRWVSIFAGLDSIRDCIAFPKNNSGRDVMLDAPSAIDQKQLDELNLIVEVKE